MSRWRRLARRRRIRSLLFGLRSYQIAEVVGSNPRYDLLTSHVIVAKHLVAKPDVGVAQTVAKAAYDQSFDAVRRRQGYNFS